MAEPAQEAFHCEVVEEQDSANRPLTRVLCHGRFVSGQTESLREAVQPLIGKGGRTVIDCSDIGYVDSSGLGALVALKISSVNKGPGSLEFVNLTPRIKELLRITKLMDYLARPDTINYGS